MLSDLTFGDADQITEAFVEAADVLTGMKVFQGDEGGFRPGDNITRAEVAALIYRQLAILLRFLPLILRFWEA